MAKSEYIIEMCKQQYEEMYDFYLSLGYSEKQTKKLCSSCFGAEIVVTEAGTVYRADWSFYRKRRAHPIRDPGGLFGGIFSKANSASGNRKGAVYSREVMTEDAFAPMAMMGAQPMPVGMPAPLPMAKMPEFNTAETNDVNETEEYGPLDKPQMIFSANVNSASWSYIRDRVSQSRSIDKSFVRIEEIINSYPFDLKKPKNDDLFRISIGHGKCPWNEGSELMMVGLKAKKSSKKVRQNLAFLVDVSGSMENDWVLTQMSLAAIMSKLKKGDHISVIAYSDRTVTVAEKKKCGEPDDCVETILSIDGIGGCTNGSEGLSNAYKYLADNFDEDGNNRVFIFTDGDFNFGITGEGGLSEFIRKKKETGIYLSIVGFGRDNFKDNKMEALARNGNGNYTFVTNPEDIRDNLWEKLASSLVTVAKDVKISVELNPYYVKKYRLIGYDARVLTQQEFNDTEKAVDGIGSEHNVVALIEFKKGTAEKTYSTRYVKAESEGNKDEFAFIEIHYKTPDDVNSVMTYTVGINDLNSAKNNNMPVISLLAAFGLVIKDSQYKGTADKELLRRLLAEVEKDESINTRKPYGHFDIIRKYLD